MDSINHPNHYTQSNIECIDAIESMLGESGFKSYCRGNCLKYLWRYNNKGGVEDLKKCRRYLDKLISILDNSNQLTSKLESNLQQHSTYVPMIGRDGCIIEKNKTYLGQDGISWIILGFTSDVKYPIRGWNCNKGERWLRPEWLQSFKSPITTSASTGDTQTLNIKLDNIGLIEIPTDSKNLEDYGYTRI